MLYALILDRRFVFATELGLLTLRNETRHRLNVSTVENLKLDWQDERCFGSNYLVRLLLQTVIGYDTVMIREFIHLSSAIALEREGLLRNDDDTMPDEIPAKPIGSLYSGQSNQVFHLQYAVDSPVHDTSQQSILSMINTFESLVIPPFLFYMITFGIIHFLVQWKLSTVMHFARQLWQIVQLRHHTNYSRMLIQTGLKIVFEFVMLVPLVFGIVLFVNEVSFKSKSIF